MTDPYYTEPGITIFHGDCRDILPTLGKVDCVITDPPYGDTSLDWDKHVKGWVDLVPSDQMWVFGSMRFWITCGREFASWRLAQDIVWEKHNGSSFHADRFRRVHEHIVHWYRGQWSEIYHDPQMTMDATPRTVRRKVRPPHMGHIENGYYTSLDGGPRLMRSVLRVRSAHGIAVHPTQKPTGIISPLIEYSTPSNETILDPFAGSGAMLRTAKDKGRKAIGIEIEEKSCEEAVKMLRQEVLRI